MGFPFMRKNKATLYAILNLKIKKPLQNAKVFIIYLNCLKNNYCVANQSAISCSCPLAKPAIALIVGSLRAPD